MAQPSPLPPPNVYQPPVPPSPLQLTNPLFHPRKEFIRDQRIVSSFSLLTLAGSGFVRLYNFPTSVINGLRRLFELRKLVLGCRENPTTHFFEFSLDQKPWANVRNIMSEKLIVAIFAVIFQSGHSFLTTLEYGREHDDRIAIAFSRPSTAPNASAIPIVPTGSTSTLPHASPMLFAVSFPSSRVLRVIDPPLALTPAILQAVRNAWPRGIADEKRLGDCYEFKLKGYGWLQENTFAIDSLQQILSLLSALDRHSFTLLTSLTMGSRSRTRDFWIFTGPQTEHASLESPPASPTESSMDLKQNGFSRHGGSTSENGRPSSDTPSSQPRSNSSFVSSPLRQVTLSTGSKLKKPFPKTELPPAFRSDTSLNDMGKLPSDVGSVDMTGIGRNRLHSQPHTPDVFYTTRPQAPPGNIYQQEFNPWNRSAPTAAHFPTTPVPPQHSRHQSMSSQYDNLLRVPLGGDPPPDNSPYDAARPRTGSLGSIPAAPPPIRARRASAPLASTGSDALQPLQIPSSTHTPVQDATRSEFGQAQRGSHDNVRIERGKDITPVPRIPTPPLLGTGASVFRDSAFSSSTGWRSTEIPITWTGKDPEPMDEKRRAALSPGPHPGEPQSSPPRVLHGPRERRQSGGPRAEHQQQQSASRPSSDPKPSSSPSPDAERASSGPALPGAWASTPQEEKKQDDVVPGAADTPSLRTSGTTTTTTMFPPTIKEQPSQEGDDATVERMRQVKVHSPEQHRAEGDGARRSEAAWVGHTMDRHERTPPREALPAPHGHAKHPTAPAMNAIVQTNSRQRPSSISEGWVLVNIDGRGKGAGTRGPAQGASPGPPRPAPHTRSSSDSRIPQSRSPAQAPTGVGKSTMSPAAKAIVMVDAIGVKEAEKEKAAQGSRIKRLLGRGKDKSGSPTPTPERGSPTPGAPQRLQEQQQQPYRQMQAGGAAPVKSRSPLQQSAQPNGSPVPARR